MSDEKYNHSEVEFKWKEIWEKNPPYKAVDFDNKPKKYILFEFPYPSGERLHVGHGRSYTAIDAMARKYRMQGFNVLLPMGWDAFGLPAENYAIKMGVNPAVTTKENVANAKAQVKSWGVSIDWNREINTTDPKYYKWTQWIFLKLLEKGLAYQSEVAVNWCPFCKTNLADEEVLADGTHERCSNVTERRMQKQWVLKITAYADRLLEDLKTVNFLPKIRIQQENWIGKSEGTEIKFEVSQGNTSGGIGEVTVFTTRPDTIFGVTAVVISPEHALVSEFLSPEVKAYIEKASKKSELERMGNKEKTGVFTGYYCINPINNERIPIWVGDYVIGSYGGGAVMVVPAHDQRDLEFAKKYKLEIRTVVGEDGILIDSGDFTGQTSKEAINNITKWLEEHHAGNKKIQFHLRDWVFSRQHYWGEPIPVIHCSKCGVAPVPEDQLPVELPYVEKYQPSGTGESPLAQMTDWVNTTCPKCGGSAKRETDTMPNWAGSNWYYLAYLLVNSKFQIPNSKKILDYWMPVDLYNGGMEHTTLHLLYSRFIYKFLFDIGVVPTLEPYARRTSHGMVLGPNGEKMSKSRGNVINPDDVIKAYGADTFRLYESFMGPFDQTIAWSEESVEGCSRFLKRVWNLVLASQGNTLQTSDVLKRVFNKTIKKVGEDIDAMKFNTAIASMMEFINVWQSDEKGLSKEDLKKFLLILAPFAPFITEELWSRLGETESIHHQKWPEFDPTLIQDEETTIVIQVNGKVRANLKLKTENSKLQAVIEDLAKKDERVLSFIEGKEIKKVIFVAGKLINFVI